MPPLMTLSGNFSCKPRIDLFNRKGAFISPGPGKTFAAIHNPQTRQTVIYKDEHNKTGILRFF